ncbi:MAG: aldo/keto reductase [Acidobacteriota bacterium]|nr:aldo/keto reductase [Acidobacteriota bacterium]
MSKEKQNRREFLGQASVGFAAAGLSSKLLKGAPALATETHHGIPYRRLGRTGEKVSCIGLGGYHIGIQPTVEGSIRIIRTAIDNGINFLDNCWDYNGGESEVRMGKALLDGYRQKAFLMTKIDGRTKALAARQLDESLERLQTDHIDLLQIHEVIRMTDPERVFGDGGTMEALLEARKAGKIRYIGFTGHKDPAIHLKMLQTASEHHFTFDTVQMPLNVMDPHYRSFARMVVPVLVAQGIGVIGMKSLANGIIPRSGIVSAIECLHYAMNLPTSVVINGCDTMDRLNQALEAARTFKPMSKTEVSALLARTAAAAANGGDEPFKTTHQFDGTYHNPQWLG